MPDIKPFRAILYDPRNVSINDVVAPPYDVISPQLQAELYERNPHNVVRLILNREENPYHSAAENFRRWREERTLIPDDVAAMYILSQSYSLPDGRQVERKGFIAACRLEDLGKGSIFPHEKTLSKPKEDRFRLFQTTHAMFSQIFGLYSDNSRRLDPHIDAVMSEGPFYDVTFEGVRNRLWKLRNTGTMLTIAEFMRGERVLVADGHHRYETALLYRDAQRLQNPRHTGKEAYNFVPMFFTNLNDPDLVILPTHRLVHSLPAFDHSSVIEKLRQFFVVTPMENSPDLLRHLASQSVQSFGLVLSDDPKFTLLSFKDRTVPMHANMPAALSALDVTILHQVVFKTILHMTDEAQEKKLHLDYEKDAAKAMEAVNSGKAQAAFLMNPTRIEQVRAVAEAGFVMPQKSTYFYPKLLSGMVTYPFTEE